MSVENVQKLIAQFGTEAVDLYQKMSRENADAMPEQFLGGFIAQKLHIACQCPVHIERKYTKMAKELGIWTTDLEKEMGGWEADIAIYEAGIPSHIVELKILGQTSLVKVDLNKARQVAKWHVPVLLGLLICEESSRDLESRREELNRELGSTANYEESRPSLDGKWYWCFACHSRNAVKPGLDVEKFLGEP
jgi:hypothetical protein